MAKAFTPIGDTCNEKAVYQKWMTTTDLIYRMPRKNVMSSRSFEPLVTDNANCKNALSVENYVTVIKMDVQCFRKKLQKLTFHIVPSWKAC